MISGLLFGKTSKEKANIKGQEIAKIKSVPRTNVKFSGADYDIEIISIDSIDGGVEIFARAWDLQGQVGFGSDGTTDIERFRIINPPVLVSDPAGTIVRDWMDDKTPKQRFLTEDPKLAILQSLAHTIKVSAKDNPRGQIVSGKIGRTTTTVYGDTGDGHAASDAAQTTFATRRSGAGTNADATGTSNMIRIEAGTTTDNYVSIYVYLVRFDSSSIPDADTISAATVSFFGDAKTDQMSQSVVLTNSALAGTVVAGDYTSHTTDMATELGTARITVTNWSITGFNDFTVTSPDTNVSKTGFTKMGLRISSDFDNAAPTWVSTAQGRASFNSADFTGTANDPVLVVTHSTPFTFQQLTENQAMFKKFKAIGY